MRFTINDRRVFELHLTYAIKRSFLNEQSEFGNLGEQVQRSEPFNALLDDPSEARVQRGLRRSRESREKGY